MSEPALVQVEPGRFRIKTVDGYHVEILQMITNSRIVETPEWETRFYDRYWCYGSLLEAAAAAWAWDGKADTEPVGYRKRGGVRTRR
jgi:hypothetical protein